MTLKEIGKRLKNAKAALEFHRRLAKGIETTDVARLKEQVSRIEKGLAALTDPKNAVRCALPKKQQRKLGLLPQV